jgi:hypothetical protein
MLSDPTWLCNPFIAGLGRLGKKSAGLIYLPLFFLEYKMTISKAEDRCEQKFANLIQNR